MRLLFRYLKQRRGMIAVFALCCMIFSISFMLYHLPLAAVLYPALLCALLAVFYAAFDFKRVRERHVALVRLRALSAELMETLPDADTIESEDYQQLIRLLREEQRRTLAAEREKQARLIDYYTTWGHQIKTPIAAMRLQLQNEDSKLSRSMSLELTRIEQYVEMLLACLRLDSDSTDYVLREYDLDGVVRQAVRRFSGEFISRRLKLNYVSTGIRVVTDEKWLTFVLEQVLSNALKYTREGEISIYAEYAENGNALLIRDTGVGIAPEDLPRIFENGYTGLNGREDRRASGLGLHLCKRILSKLGFGISVSSELGKGTIVRIDLAQKRIQGE